MRRRYRHLGNLTPWWAGDHIGLSPPALFFYGLGALIWTAGANLVYEAGPLWQRLAKPDRLEASSRRAYRVLVALCAGSFPLLMTATALEAWLRPR